ncbi:hypothetical protein Godav_005426 [Gossypium davidsonii]|uniref:Caffeoyl-CoA O-methyltransferase n=1 Tax=Gossypium davidsonii TaxID=34287 RepID=A0A7J8T5D7_GOSDV|nr:hypothetical protein [Gossypium davidsonii]
MDNEKKRSASFSKGLLQSGELYQYVLETNVYPREPELLKELRDMTATHPRAIMATAPDAGQLIAMLLKLNNAKRTIEIVAIDMNREAYEIGLPVIKKAGVENKIEFIESEALPVLDQLLEDVGGIVVYDNTLWAGSVAMPEECTPEILREGRQRTLEFNKLLAADPRVEISLAPLGDGITICRRMH